MERIKCFDVYLTQLDPTVGYEIKKTRPCVIVSNDLLNDSFKTVIVVPLSTQAYKHPYRITTVFRNKESVIITDQIRSIDKRRLLKKMGTIDENIQYDLITILQKMFGH